MKEFGFYNFDDKNILLSDEIEITDKKDTHFLVANSSKLNADIIAPEVDFYLKNSADSALKKAKNTLMLYEARAKCFDLSKDIDYEKRVGKNVLFISNGGRESLVKILKDQGYKVINFTHFEIKFIYGAIGELTAIILQNGDEIELDCDILLAQNAQPYMLKQSGCIEILGKSDDEILDILSKSTPIFTYKSYVNYDSSICQYHERRGEICAKCVKVCPSVAILKDDEKRHLVFSHVDCINCGECVSVCPSGALEYSRMPRAAFAQIARMYKDKIALVLSKDVDLSGLNLSLPVDVVPFMIEAGGFLDHAHLLTLLEESGANVVFYAPIKTKALISAINLINQIYQAKFGVNGVLLAKNESELNLALKDAKFIENSHYQMSEYALLKREIFAKRLEWLVGDESLGDIITDEMIEYAKISINQDSCTLCLSCVGACNVNALIADKKDNSIKFNPSICTACGYCELSCAERDTIKLIKGNFKLAPEFFTYKELARDELFKCIECGKEFATKKAVEKIASIMKPRFLGQDEKIKTLYCCADCKAKIMIKAQIAAIKEGKFYE